MDDKKIALLWAEALKSDNRDAYVSDWATSSIWGDPETLADADLLEIAEQVGNIWDVAHMSVKEMCKACGMTQTALALKFCIPKRTVEDWCRGVAKCSDYARLMMAELLGLIKR